MMTPEEIRKEQEEFGMSQLFKDTAERSILSLDKDISTKHRQTDRSKKRHDDKQLTSKGLTACLAKIVKERRNIGILDIYHVRHDGELLEFDSEALRIRTENGAYWIMRHVIAIITEEERGKRSDDR